MRKPNQKINAGRDNSEVENIKAALSAPFHPTEVRFKPAVVNGNRALALAYVDARVIQDRLDSVLGVDGWQDSYRSLEDGTVICRLKIRFGQDWITKMDVGGPGDQGNCCDRRKAAFSDALKRAAVKFGIGRYLYRFPRQWVDYDPNRKQFTKSPQLPDNAIPQRDKGPENKKNIPEKGHSNSKKLGHILPASGEELELRLKDYDANLASQGLSQPGQLIKAVIEAGEAEGFGPEMKKWAGKAFHLAAQVTRSFEAKVRGQGNDKREVA